MKTEKEKAAEVLKKRDEARKGIEHEDPKGCDPLKAEEKKQQKVEDLGLGLGVGLRRSG
ncbi:MAG TPA: hypothetical protein VHA70_04965 [Bauldia sp.]|nr:hypothetical protein [Bauldia sp.]